MERMRSWAKQSFPRQYCLLHRIYAYVLFQWRKIALRLLVFYYFLRNRLSSSQVCGVHTAPVVSLTSYGIRVQSVYLTIESIGKGSEKPSQLILWLDEEVLIQQPPATLQRLKKRGLQIRACANFGPHKKYYPYVIAHSEFCVPLVTADDDVFYPKWWLSRLDNAYNTAPNYVHCYRARRIALGQNGMKPYDQWTYCLTKEPSYLNVATGINGILYPPAFLNELKTAGDGFQACAPRGDDLWLHMQAVKHGYRHAQICTRQLYFLPLPGTEDNGLCLTNISGGNDKQIQLTYTSAEIERILSEKRTQV